MLATQIPSSAEYPTAVLFQDILEGLQKDFYYHLRTPISEKQFREIVNLLGTVIRQEDVRLHASTRLLHQPEALRYHTDQPYVDIIGWQCIVPDPEGPTLLLNMADLLQSFDPKEISLFQEIIVNYPNPDNLADLHPEPLLTIKDGYLRLFYISFRGSKKMAPEALALWQRFNDYVKQRAKDKEFGVILKKGECLFLHNKTFLHARPAISKESKRFLNRIWIQSSLVKGVKAKFLA
jgi:hypothetical protein